MGSDDNIIPGAGASVRKSNPRLVVLMSSGLSEAQGSDMNRALKAFRLQYPKFERNEIVTVSTPDFTARWKTATALIEKHDFATGARAKLRSIRKTHQFITQPHADTGRY